MSFGELNNIRLFSYRDSSHGRRCVARPGPPDSPAPLGTGTLYLGARATGKCSDLSSWGQRLTSYITDSTAGDKLRQTAALLNATRGFAKMGGTQRDGGIPPPPAPTRSWTTGPGVSRVRERETAPGTCRRMPRPVDLCHECYLPALKARHLM